MASTDEPSPKRPPKSPVAPLVRTAQDLKKQLKQKHGRGNPDASTRVADRGKGTSGGVSKLFTDSSTGRGDRTVRGKYGTNSSNNTAGVKRRRSSASGILVGGQDATNSRSLFDDIGITGSTATSSSLTTGKYSCRSNMGRLVPGIGVGVHGSSSHCSSSGGSNTSLFGEVMKNASYVVNANDSSPPERGRPGSSGSASSKTKKGEKDIGSSETPAELSADLLAKARSGASAYSCTTRQNNEERRVIAQSITATSSASNSGASSSRDSRSGDSDTVEATRFGEYDASSNGPTIKAASTAETMSTPTKSSGDGDLFSNIGASKRAASPGGYGMMGTIMNMVEGSPYKAKKAHDEENLVQEEESEGTGNEEDDNDKGDGGRWKMARLFLPRWLSRALTLDDNDDEEGVDSGVITRNVGDSKEGTKANTANDAIKKEPLDEVSAFDMPTQPAATHEGGAVSPAPRGKPPELNLTQKHVDVEASDRTDDEPDMNVGLIDWSLKRRLTLECHPGRALPGGLICGPGSGPDVERLAMELFFNGRSSTDIITKEKSNSHRHKSEDAVVAARWKAAQMYWRHPSVYPLPKGFFGVHSLPNEAASRKGMSTINQNSSMGPPPPRRANAKALRFASTTRLHGADETEAAAIRAAAMRIVEHRITSIRSMGFGSSSTAAPAVMALMSNPTEIIRQRELEWMEAFRSLYYAWMEKIDHLRLAIRNHSTSSWILDGVARTYFYVVSPVRTVLFRCKLFSSSVIEPMVLCSSTSAELRYKLKDMGVTIYILDKPADEEDGKDAEEGAVFNESIFENDANSGLSKQEEDEAKKADDELEALRRASTQTAGADIEVSKKKKKSANMDKVKDDKIFSPLYVKGDEECMAFYELLLNTKGRLDFGGASSSPESDVPLLIHRAFGPTANASLHSLSEVFRKDDDYWALKATKEQESKSAHEDVHPSIQLEGPILPCALRDLLHSSVCSLLLDKTRQNDCVDTGEDSMLELVGSHYLVWTATLQEPQEGGSHGSSVATKAGRAKKAAKRMAYYMKETGEASSSLFNSDLDQWRAMELKHNEISSQEGDISSCGPREFVEVLIWNVENPEKVSYWTTDVASSTPTS